MYQASKYLATIGENGVVTPQGDITDATFDKSWVENLSKADYIVINVGLWWHNRDTKFEHYKTMVDFVLGMIKSNFRGEKVIFRTSTMGNEKCLDAQLPLPNLPDLTWDSPEDRYDSTHVH